MRTISDAVGDSDGVLVLVGDAVGEDVGARVAVNVRVGDKVDMNVAVAVALGIGEGDGNDERLAVIGVTIAVSGIIAKETWHPVPPSAHPLNNKRRAMRRSMRGNLT